MDRLDAWDYAHTKAEQLETKIVDIHAKAQAHYDYVWGCEYDRLVERWPTATPTLLKCRMWKLRGELDTGLSQAHLSLQRAARLLRKAHDRTERRNDIRWANKPNRRM
ncbi:hypothetical protein LCGC14_0552430 [marine sediment metagenome]|uniref:Uncharacterized protein n=1 Tax=marine sediment metagenome TaxID=412755 RepID=A0A0F9RPI1_9ZZZZ